MRKHRQGRVTCKTRGLYLMLSAIASSICSTNVQIKFGLCKTLPKKVINNAKIIRLWLRKIKNGFIVDKRNELIAKQCRLIGFSGDLKHFYVQMVREFIQQRKVHKNGLNYSISVSKAIGHSSIKQTEHYARLLEKTVISDMKLHIMYTILAVIALFAYTYKIPVTKIVYICDKKRGRYNTTPKG